MAGGRENLKPFKKGDPRTIAAAKKSKRRPSMVGALIKELDKKPVKAVIDMIAEQHGVKITGKDYAELVAKVELIEMLKGNVQAIKNARDQVDGKAKETVEHQGSITILKVDQ